MYSFFRNLLFLLPAETAHYVSMNLLKAACSVGLCRSLIARSFSPKAVPTSLLGLQFRNPVGLGAGFDKNARYLRELEALGFGFVEIGTVTPRPQAGNDKPRLFRLPKDGALVNRMGFNNDGVDQVTRRLKAWRKSRKAESGQASFLVGGNIGKNKSTPNEEAWKDYEICFRALHPYVDFFVVNVSSPNTPGLRELQEKDALKKILVHLQEQNKSFDRAKPILLKIAPDLTNTQVDDVIALAREIRLDGLVASNTTISREGLKTGHPEVEAIGAGGLSGKPLKQKATELIRYISKQTGGSLPLIGSGGIFTAEDAVEKKAAGANLVEVWTGFIYEGPSVARRICKGWNSGRS
ncbi:MAG TPA: quinone-dependent dihydroorotate dehydrogenase [Flavisolibacter sp.]|nr:quinone-dependent dihydroorotate dehydrogenase [Flavisolibacter sp.]